MREGTISRVTAADRPYGEFYYFYSVSPENFGSTHVLFPMEVEKGSHLVFLDINIYRMLNGSLGHKVY